MLLVWGQLPEHDVLVRVRARARARVRVRARVRAPERDVLE